MLLAATGLGGSDVSTDAFVDSLLDTTVQQVFRVGHDSFQGSRFQGNAVPVKRFYQCAFAERPIDDHSQTAAAAKQVPKPLRHASNGIAKDHYTP